MLYLRSDVRARLADHVRGQTPGHEGSDPGTWPFRTRAAPVATIDRMADQTPSQPLDQQLQEIGAQLAWVRDYL